MKNSKKNPKDIDFSSIYDFMKLTCHVIMDRIKANNRKKPKKKVIYENSVSVSVLAKKYWLPVSDRDPRGNPGNCRDKGFCRNPGTGKISLFCRDSLPGFYTKFSYKNVQKN